MKITFAVDHNIDRAEDLKKEKEKSLIMNDAIMPLDNRPLPLRVYELFFATNLFSFIRLIILFLH